MAIVLPEGIFGNKSLGYIWAYLKKHGKVLAMIDCPRNTFQPSTDTKTKILQEFSYDVLLIDQFPEDAFFRLCFQTIHMCYPYKLLCCLV